MQSFKDLAITVPQEKGNVIDFFSKRGNVSIIFLEHVRKSKIVGVFKIFLT